MRFRAFILGMVLSLLLHVQPLSSQESVLTLRECFQRALLRSDTLGISEQDIKIAEAHYLQALSTALPHIDVRADELIQDTAPISGGGDGSVGQTFTRRSRPEVAINLTQKLFQGFREFRAVKAAGAEKKQNVAETERVRQLLFQDVARAYYTVLELEKELQLIQSLRGTLQKRINELESRIGLGKSRSSELLSNESGLALNQANIEQTKGLILTARDYLGFLTGAPVTEKLVDEFPLPPTLASLENFLDRKGQRPDVIASQEGIRFAQGVVDVEKGLYYPTLDLEANYYPYRVGFLSDIDWDVGFFLTVPIFHGGETRGRVNEAKAQLKQSQFSSSETTRRVELEIRQAYNTLYYARSQEQALRIAEVKAGENYRAQSEEYQLGLVNNLDVLQSLATWQETRLDVNKSHYQTKLEYLNLLTATGDLPPKEF